MNASRRPITAVVVFSRAALNGRASLSRNVLLSLRALGATTFVICSQGLLRIASRSRLHAGVVFCAPNLSDAAPTIVRVINDLHAKSPIDVVIGVDVHDMAMLSTLNSQLHVPVFPLTDAKALRELADKWSFYQLCQRCGVDVPRTLYFATKVDLGDSQSLGFPLVIKPVGGQASEGVVIVRDLETLRREVLAKDSYAYDGYLAQEYVEGTDWGTSVFARDGGIEHWTMFEYQRTGEVLTSMRFTEHAVFEDSVRRLVREVNFTGVANFDARIDRATNEVRLLECNPRFFACMRAVRLAGLDFVQAGLAAHGLAARPRQSLCQGEYHFVASLKSVAGWTKIATGAWPVSLLLRDVIDVLIDPLPTAMRFVGKQHDG